MVTDASEILRVLLKGGHSTVASRLAGAFRNIGRNQIADEIVKTMQAAGLITVNGRKGINLISWEKLAAIFEIKEIKFSYVNGTARPDLALSALFIEALWRPTPIIDLAKPLSFRPSPIEPPIKPVPIMATTPKFIWYFFYKNA